MDGASWSFDRCGGRCFLAPALFAFLEQGLTTGSDAA
jgi:hypothetical protein